ncbi:MAG: hypothetical protein EAX96_06260 [Candidatus Lokiarchaeota archaeon]|nr:hypothetical protein [Candidatus Lokiarchaeota archaeon]
MKIKLKAPDTLKVSVYSNNESETECTWKLTLISNKNLDLKVEIIRFEPDHDGQVFRGVFKRDFKDGESCEDIKVALPCGCNSNNDKLKVKFQGRNPATDDIIQIWNEFDHQKIVDMGAR